jgi:hypothetical protein
MPIKKPAPDAIKKRDHAQSVPACSPRSKVILGLDNQHGIYREHPNGYSRPHGFDKKTGTFGNYLNFRPLFSVGDAPQRDRQNSPIDNSRNAPQIRPDGTN